MRGRRLGSWWYVAIVLTGTFASGCLTSPTTASIGAVLARDTHTGAVHVREVPPGLAADAAGLVPGDRIKMIDGVHVDELDGARIQALLRGAAGSRVVLTVIRADEVLRIELTRERMGTTPAVAPREQRIE